MIQAQLDISLQVAHDARRRQKKETRSQ
jgi:hypothetical protein